MEYEFYIDVFFLVDGFFNVLALVLSAAFLRQDIGVVRIILAGAIGSFWNCFLVLYPFFTVGEQLLITVFGIGSLMSVCAFPEMFRGYSESLSVYRLFRNGVQADMVLVIASFLVSGGVSLAKEHLYLTDLECVMLGGCVCALAYRLVRKSLKLGKTGAKRYCVHLFYHGNKKEFCALADSGNRLRVPETGKPVVLISHRDCKGFCEQISGGCFYIPYRAVGTEKGLLFAVMFEKMEIFRNGGKDVIEHPVVAIVKEGLSDSGDFNMILPEEYVPEE